MPLTDDGFEPENEDDILADVTALATNLFGEDIDTGETAVMGQFVRLISHKLAEQDQYIEAIYLSWFYDSATGVSLDRVAALVGLTRNNSQPAYVTLSFKGTPSYYIEPDTEFQTSDGQMFALEDAVTLGEDGTGSGTAVSLEESDEANVSAATIVEQVAPVEDITEVTNADNATGGTLAETDDEFRERINSYETTSSGATQEGIQSAIKNVTGVDQVSVITNNTNEADSDGNPAKAVHIYVTGGVDADVAQAISDTMAAGTQTVGKVVTQVIDDGGNEQEIHFDRPISVPVFMKIALTTDSNTFETDGVDEIKQNMQDYISSLSMGAVIRNTYLYTLVYSVTGVVDAEITLGRAVDSLSGADIKLSSYESAGYVADDIEVTTDAE